MILDSENLFNRLPEDVLLSIFDKLHDAKSLCSSMSVCKRFYSLILQVDQIFLPIPRKTPVPKSHKSRNLFMKFIAKMMKLKSKKEDCVCDCNSYYEPNEILKPFQEIKSLHVRIPCCKNGRLDSKTGNFASFLKWEAEFGSQLESCVILGAKSLQEKGDNEENLVERECDYDFESDIIPEAEVKQRIVWTISCLIAASARHEMVQEIVKCNKMIENVVITDETGQGKVCVNKGQIEEMRNLKEDRRLQSLGIKMWYMEKLEVPSLGKVVEGATVVVIRPVGGGDDGGVEELVARAFGGEMGERVIGEAVGQVMAANKCYTLDLSSF